MSVPLCICSVEKRKKTVLLGEEETENWGDNRIVEYTHNYLAWSSAEWNARQISTIMCFFRDGECETGQQIDRSIDMVLNTSTFRNKWRNINKWFMEMLCTCKEKSAHCKKLSQQQETVARAHVHICTINCCFALNHFKLEFCALIEIKFWMLIGVFV